MIHPSELFRFLALCDVQRCLQSRRDGAERAGPPDTRSDFRYAAAVVERVRGLIIILPVQNFAACAKLFCQTDGHSRTLRVGFRDDEWLGEEVLQLAGTLERQPVGIGLRATVSGPQHGENLPY